MVKKSSEIHAQNKRCLIINVLQRGPWRRPACRNSPQPDDCEIPWAGYATWSCRCICGILVWHNHHVKGILNNDGLFSKLTKVAEPPCEGHPLPRQMALEHCQCHTGEPTTEIYDMAGKHWLNTISLLSGGAVRRTWPPHGLGKWEVPAGDKFSRERGRRKR